MERVRQHDFTDTSAADDIIAPEVGSQAASLMVRSNGVSHLETC